MRTVYFRVYQPKQDQRCEREHLIGLQFRIRALPGAHKVRLIWNGTRPTEMQEGKLLRDILRDNFCVSFFGFNARFGEISPNGAAAGRSGLAWKRNLPKCLYIFGRDWRKIPSDCGCLLKEIEEEVNKGEQIEGRRTIWKNTNREKHRGEDNFEEGEDLQSS